MRAFEVSALQTRGTFVTPGKSPFYVQMPLIRLERMFYVQEGKKKNFYGNVRVDASITFTCIRDPISEIKLTVNRMLASFPIIAITKRTYFVLYTQGVRMSSMELKYLKNITTTWNYLRYNSYTKHKLRETKKTLYIYRCSIK